jgi:hypothetical protein
MREERPDESGGEAPGVEQDVASRGDEGRRAQQVTPPIADDAEQGQTSSPAEEGDVGVPSDEELADEDRG